MIVFGMAKQEIHKASHLTLSFNLASGLIYLGCQCCLRKDDKIVPWKERSCQEATQPNPANISECYVHKAYSLGILSNVQEMGIAGLEGVPGIRDGIEL